MKPIVILLFLAGLAPAVAVADAPTVSVNVEEEVYTLVPPDNGSGPFWSYGCTTILRLKDGVIVSQMETGPDVPKLSNTRWVILRRTEDGWKREAEAEDYLQREPCPLATLDRETFLLNVNDLIVPPRIEYGPARPHLLHFSLKDSKTPSDLQPRWKGEPRFTDHSYRGFAVDPDSGNILMLNIDAETSEQNWALMNGDGETSKNGAITFPIRACYPQVALRGAEAHVLAIGDIREPVQEWAEYKRAQTGRDWDYVFRILYYTYTPDLRGPDFIAPIEVANVDATAGHISNQDLWISPDGSAYILYTQREVQSELMRDKFFPDRSILNSFHLAVVKDGEVVERRLLHEGRPGEEIAWARFHETVDGTVYAVVYVSGETPRNALLPIHPNPDAPEYTILPLKTPFGAFLLANVRAGNLPSNTIDMLGHAGSGTVVSYAEIEIGG